MAGHKGELGKSKVTLVFKVTMASRYALGNDNGSGLNNSQLDVSGDYNLGYQHWDCNFNEFKN